MDPLHYITHLTAPLTTSPEAAASVQWSGATEQSMYRAWDQVVSLEHYLQSSAPSWFFAVLARYVNTDPLEAALIMVGLFALYCWLASLTTGNCSQVDRLWSIIPFVYVWHFAAHDLLKATVDTLVSTNQNVASLGGVTSTMVTANFNQIVALLGNVDFVLRHVNVRLAVMAYLTTLWGLRLTFNFARKGGYLPGEEDYRWPVLRERLHPLVFQAFNLTFIAAYQNLLLFLFVSPAYIAYRGAATPWNVVDTVATLLFLAFLFGETLADQQQWVFQSAKHNNNAASSKSSSSCCNDQFSAEQLKLGFITTGLFRYSRHPNFFCEMSIWWSFYLFSVAASGVWLNWTIVGTVLLTLLFQGSTGFTESLSLKKYPEYAKYQKTTSRLIPLYPGPPLVKGVTKTNTTATATNKADGKKNK